MRHFTGRPRPRAARAERAALGLGEPVAQRPGEEVDRRDGQIDVVVHRAALADKAGAEFGTERVARDAHLAVEATAIVNVGRAESPRRSRGPTTRCRGR
jgi:hypothetical protein